MTIEDRIKQAIDRTNAAAQRAADRKEQRQPSVQSTPLEITPGGSFDLGATVDDENLKAAGGYPPDNEPNLGLAGEGSPAPGAPAGDSTYIADAKPRRYQTVRQDAADKLSMFTAKLDIASEAVRLVARAAPGQVNRITITISPLGGNVGIADRRDKLNTLGATSFGAPLGSVFQNAFILPPPNASGNAIPITISTTEELWAQAVTGTSWVSVLVEQFFADDNERGLPIS